MIYFPYFRGRQFDLSALKQFAAQSTEDIIPIIEPVRDVAALPATLRAFIDADKPLAVIQNPQVDHYHFQATQRYPINELITAPHIKPAYILTPLTPPELLENKLVIVQHYDDLKLFIQNGWLPKSATILAPPEARIRRLLHDYHFGHIFDHYTVPEHSIEFSQLPDSFFSNDLTFASDYNEIGFSDFLT